MILLDLIPISATQFLALLLLLAIIALIGLWLRAKLLALRRQPTTVDKSRRSASQPLFFSSQNATAIPRVSRLLLDINHAGTHWAGLMHKLGGHFQQAGVRQVIFVHGTFVGSDPMNLIESFATLLPKKYSSVIGKFHGFTKSSSDRLTRDLGNFPPPYVRIFSAYTGLPAESLIWSSGNHHAARLDGAYQLLGRITELANKAGMERKRILLCGHSHAGQLFAILSNLAFNPHLRDALHDFRLRLHPTDSPQMWQERYALLKTLPIDLVTFGTPVHYPFVLQDPWQLLHIVNDRSLRRHCDLDLAGALTTKGGDYIQHWAVFGSDSRPLQKRIRNLNHELEHFFGQGVSMSLLERVSQQNRLLQGAGINALVDYHDNSRKLPNFMLTMFGHGTYTRYRHMLFNTALIAHLLYGGEQPQKFLANI